MPTAPLKATTPTDAPHRPRRHATWTERCPYCPGALTAAQHGLPVLTCDACKVTLPPPRAAESPWMGDPRTGNTHGPWQAYTRSGGLAEVWGTSTDRENGGPPASLDEPEDPAKVPRIRQEATRGDQDRLLDGVIAGYAAGTAALADMLRTLRAEAIRKARAGTTPATPRKGRPRKGSDVADVLLAHLAETTGGTTADDDARPYLRRRFAPGGYVLPALYTRDPDGTLTPSDRDDRPAPVTSTDAEDTAALAFWLRVASTMPAIHDGLAAGAVTIAANLLIQRGVDASSTVGGEPGTGEPLALRLPRKERWAGTAHAVEVAFSQPTLSPRPGSSDAPALHSLKGGLRYNEVTCHPSHGSSGRAPGENAVIDHLDARTVLESLSPADLAILSRDDGAPANKADKARLRLARDRYADALRARATRGEPAMPEQGMIPAKRPRKASAPHADPFAIAGSPT